MNPQLDSIPGLHLPQPSSETPMALNAQPQILPGQNMVPLLVNPAYTPSAMPQQVVQAPINTGQLTPVTQAQQTAHVSIKDADEEALTEEWISKTKTILEDMQADPYSESNAISKAKADYLKTCHGITLKVSDNT